MKRYEYKMVTVRDLVGLGSTLGDALATMNGLGQEGWRMVCVLGDQAAVFVREADAEPAAHGLYMIEANPDAGYPPCKDCGDDAYWDLDGFRCSRCFAAEAGRQRMAAEKRLCQALARAHGEERGDTEG